MTGGIWFTSDLHLGHQKVAESRGFESTHDHDGQIIANWPVRSRDSVYILGDLTCDQRKRDYALGVLAQLPGTKHLIAGNHDDVSSIHRNGWKHLPAYLEVFASVRDFGKIRTHGQDVLMSHYPYMGEGADHSEIPRYAQYRLPDLGGWLIHGHTHLADQRRHGRQIHVGLDAWDLTPVPLAQVERLMAEDA